MRVSIFLFLIIIAIIPVNLIGSIELVKPFKSVESVNLVESVVNKGFYKNNISSDELYGFYKMPYLYNNERIKRIITVHSCKISNVNEDYSRMISLWIIR